MKTPAIALTDVTKRFGSHAALDRVSLEVATAEAVVIVGPSGCGKTTLLRIVAGLEIAETGQVVLGELQWERRAGRSSPRIGARLGSFSRIWRSGRI